MMSPSVADSDAVQRVGLYIHPWHSFGRAMLRGVIAFAREHPQWELVTPWPGEHRWADLPDFKLDGIIFRTGTGLEPGADFAQGLTRVVIGNTSAHKHVDMDWAHDAIGRLAAEHLIEQGHQTLISVVDEEERHYQDERALGFAKTAEASNIDHTRIVVTQNDESTVVNWMANLPRPCGIFATTDRIGHMLLDTARHIGRSVPEEIAIVGVGDDEEFCEVCSPPMSSVALPGEQLGYSAAALLKHRMHGDKAPVETTRFAPSYVTVRHSSDLLAVDDPMIVRALRFIRDHVTNGIGAAEVVKAVPLSRRALETRFKKMVGRSIEEEVRRVRVDRARRLLQSTELQMPDIAARTGFTSAQRLSVVFARLTGESPSRYRARLRQPQIFHDRIPGRV